MPTTDDLILSAELRRIAQHGTDAAALVHRMKTWPGMRSRQEAMNSLMRHAKGLQCAAALLRQQIEHGT